MGTGSGAQSRQMDLSAGSMGGTRRPSLFWENTNIPHSNFSVKYFAISGSVKSFSSSHLDLLNSHLHLSAFQCSSHLLHWLSCLNPPSEAWCTHHSQSLLYGSSWIFSPRAPFQVFLVSTFPYLISALVCLQHQRTSSLILPISIICWRPTVGHLDELCDAVCTPSLLRTSSPATSSFWRTHFGSISSKTVEESLPISSNRHYLLPCPQSFLLTLLFSHSVSTRVSMLRVLVSHLRASSDQLCTYQSRTPSACVPSELNPTWSLLNCELLGRFRKSLNQLLPQDLSLPWFVFLYKLIGLILHTYFFSH